MEIRPDQFKLMLPVPVTVITTVNPGGAANAAPYGCVMPVLRPLELIAVASALPRDTLRNIRDTGHFVVKVMGRPSFEKAMKTARSYPPDVSELEEEGIETFPSKKVRPPRISDALGWAEAVFDQEVTGENYSVVLGRVVCAELNDKYLVGDSVGDVRETMKLFAGGSS